jgi:hypothetical protein
LTTGNSAYQISTKGTRRVWPVSRGCLLLRGGPCCPTLDFVIAFWITITFYTLLTSLFFILVNIYMINVIGCHFWCPKHGLYILLVILGKNHRFWRKSVKLLRINSIV